ncbi:MAG: imelysin family protein [Saprospiraceae bacterium]
MRSHATLILFLLLLSTIACKKNEPEERDDFDRAAMLENYALHLIRPAYEQLLDEITALENSWTAFTVDATESHLLDLQEQWLATAVAWEAANAFNFGPAGEEGLRKGLVEEIGTFPVDTDKMESLISTGDVSLSNFDRDSRGMLAIEYLLYGTTGNVQDVQQALQDDNRRAYLAAILRHLYTEVERVVDTWEAYQSEFINNDGTDVGSATSQLYNEFVRSYEAAKNFKVGLPAGKRAGQSQSEPRLVEAYYSGKSLELLQAHLASIDRIYYGRSLTGTDGLGFHEYLQAVEGGAELISLTQAQWQSVQNALAQIPQTTSFSQLIEQNDPTVDDLHTEMQKQIRFFKSDMSSLLGIAITFNSGDGD